MPARYVVFSFILQHAHALEVLSDKLTDGATALDVGSGSGYLTACFARMVSFEILLLFDTIHVFSDVFFVTLMQSPAGRANWEGCWD